MATTLSSCLFFDLLYALAGYDNYSGGIASSIVAAAYDDDPVVVPPSGGETKKPLPPGQIAGPASSEESDDSEPDDNGGSIKDIFSRPTFTLGPSIGWLGGDKEESEKFPVRPGFQLGASLQIPIAGNIYIEPGLMYANRGAKYKYEESGMYDYQYSQKKTLHYLEIPAFVSGRINENFSIYGGPQLGFLLGAKTVNDTEGNSSTEKGTDGFKKIDVGIAAGVKYAIPNTFFSIGLGYYHGFSNLNDNTYDGGYDVPKNQMNAVRLGAYYSYHSGKHKHRGSTGPIR